MTLLFRALAGLWPWGTGRIKLPKRATIFFMPRRPYLPPGSLREVLTYPQSGNKFEARAFVDALDRVGLSRLAPMLDRPGRWDQELNGDEQQNLMLARLLIHRPQWLVLDDLLDAIDDATRARAFEIFSNDLECAAIVHIGRATSADPSFTRCLRVLKDPKVRRMSRRKSVNSSGLLPAIQPATVS